MTGSGAQFTEFVTQYPGHPQAAAAQGTHRRTYYRQREYRRAMGEYQRPWTRTQAAQVSKTLLKIGLCQRALGDGAHANHRAQVIKQFPKATRPGPARSWRRGRQWSLGRLKSGMAVCYTDFHPVEPTDKPMSATDERIRMETGDAPRRLSLGDAAYPANLREIQTPPGRLYVRGALAGDDALAVAIVGARAATPYGVAVAERLAADLAARGVTVVSGLARGVDLPPQGAPGRRRTDDPVLGSGVDVIHPRESPPRERDRSVRCDRVAVRAGDAAVVRIFPSPQPRDRRAVAGSGGRRSGREERLVDHGRAGGRAWSRGHGRARASDEPAERGSTPAHRTAPLIGAGRTSSTAFTLARPRQTDECHDRHHGLAWPRQSRPGQHADRHVEDESC